MVKEDWRHNYLILNCLAEVNTEVSMRRAYDRNPRSLMEKKVNEALENEEFGSLGKWTEQELEVIEPKTIYYIDKKSGMNSNSKELKLKLDFLIKNGHVEKLAVGSKTKYKITLSGFKFLGLLMALYKLENKAKGNNVI